MSSTTPMPEPRVLVDGLAYVESPRWHEDRLWFAHWERARSLPSISALRDHRARLSGRLSPEGR